MTIPTCGAALADSGSPPAVAVSIKPLHSLVAAVMAGVGEPDLLIVGGERAVRRTLTGAGLKKLRGASILFWIGPEFETGIAKQLPRSKSFLSVPLLRASGIRHIDVRPGRRRVIARTPRPKFKTAPAAPGKARVGDGKITFRKRGEPAKARPARPATRVVPGSARQQTGVAKPDPRIWLDPRNGIALARDIAGRLAAADPKNAARYRRNAAVLLVQLETVDASITSLLRPLRKESYVVLNNGLQYFEEHYLLAPALELGLSRTPAPPAAVARAAKRLAGATTDCVLAGPEIASARARRTVAKAQERVALLDPFGLRVRAGPGAYARIIDRIGKDVASCLGAGS